jgi:hypothetical protein
VKTTKELKMHKIYTHRDEEKLIICKELLPQFVHLSPKEAAEKAVMYAEALMKELEEEC